MADYYTIEQLTQKLDMEGSQVSELLAKAAISPAVRNGRNYYSARHLHQLQAALRLARRQGISFEEALQMVLARVSRMEKGSAA